MTRKHYEAIAAIFSDHMKAAEKHEKAAIIVLCQDIAIYLNRENPRFDYDKFMSACGDEFISDCGIR